MQKNGKLGLHRCIVDDRSSPDVCEQGMGGDHRTARHIELEPWDPGPSDVCGRLVEWCVLPTTSPGQFHPHYSLRKAMNHVSRTAHIRLRFTCTIGVQRPGPGPRTGVAALSWGQWPRI